MEEHQTIVWSGTTPLGLPMVLERDERDRWIATVAGTMRSRNRSAAIAVAEAAGLRTREPWVRLIAGMAVARDPAVAA
jgi:hypothetical protein